jgi:hypothetical protein
VALRAQAVVLAALALASCAPHMIYLRADGQVAANDPVLHQQFEMDRTVCQGELQKANVSGVTYTGGGLIGALALAERSQSVDQVGQGCMASRGYVLVREDEAPAKQQELASIAAERARREAAAAAPPPPPPESRRTAALQPKPQTPAQQLQSAQRTQNQQ